MSWHKDRLRQMKKRAARQEYESLRSMGSAKKAWQRQPTKAELRIEADKAFIEWSRPQCLESVSAKSLQLDHGQIEIPPWEDQNESLPEISDAPRLSTSMNSNDAAVDCEPERHGGQPKTI